MPYHKSSFVSAPNVHLGSPACLSSRPRISFRILALLNDGEQWVLNEFSYITQSNLSIMLLKSRHITSCPQSTWLAPLRFINWLLFRPNGNHTRPITPNVVRSLKSQTHSPPREREAGPVLRPFQPTFLSASLHKTALSTARIDAINSLTRDTCEFLPRESPVAHKEASLVCPIPRL